VLVAVGLFHAVAPSATLAAPLKAMLTATFVQQFVKERHCVVKRSGCG
jgi:hypothetical protein